MSVNPLPICTALYGYQNVNDVRDCVLDNIRRYYGPFCDFHQQGLYETIQNYLIQILKQAGRNPNAIKLGIPPPHLQPRFFFDLYEKSNNKLQAYRQCKLVCEDNEDCKKHCLIDYYSVSPLP